MAKMYTNKSFIKDKITHTKEKYGSQNIGQITIHYTHIWDLQNLINLFFHKKLTLDMHIK